MTPEISLPAASRCSYLGSYCGKPKGTSCRILDPSGADALEEGDAQEGAEEGSGEKGGATLSQFQEAAGGEGAGRGAGRERGEAGARGSHHVQTGIPAGESGEAGEVPEGPEGGVPQVLLQEAVSVHKGTSPPPAPLRIPGSASLRTSVWRPTH